MPPTVRKPARVLSVLLALVHSASIASAQLVQPSLKLTADQQSQIHDLAARILKHADFAGCKKSCTILVANFTGETGSTSHMGMQLADGVSSQLAAQASGGIQIASRLHLQQYLEKERIPSKLLEDDNAARWLATENSATVVLIGYLRIGLTQASLHVQLLDTRDFGKSETRGKTFVDEVTFNDISNFGDVDPAEPFGEPQPLDAPKDTLDYSKHDARDKASPPHCTYKPMPPFTKAAQLAKFNVSLVVQVIISKDGTVSDPHILKGAPFGMNKQALDVVRTWRCQPATVDGQPVPTRVPIEISFRLF